MKIHRPMFCPICGAGLMVSVDCEQFPEVHRLPEHPSANGMNLCAAVVITVTLDFDHCRKCDARISKHPSGLCMACYSRTSIDD